MSPFTLGGVDDQITAVIVTSGAFFVAIVSIVTGAVRSVLVSKHREESRREIAAYVAEGSITSDDAAKLLAAGNSSWKNACWNNKA